MERDLLLIEWILLAQKFFQGVWCRISQSAIRVQSKLLIAGTPHQNQEPCGSSGTHQDLSSKLCGHFDFSSSILLVSLSLILFPTFSLFISLQLSFSLSPSISLILSHPKSKNRFMWYWYILLKEYVSNIHMKMIW